jgi:dTMP kinase
MNGKTCYGSPPPGLDPSRLSGMLFVVEGADSSGRSTQIEQLAQWLQQRGSAVVRTGLTRSTLVGSAIGRAKEGNVLSPRTMSLFYATDFYDQMENVIVPALRAGSVVLADRYIFTLLARDIVRGAEPGWTESVYSMAIVPDAVFFLAASPQTLVERTLSAYHRLDYWESGMDLGLSRDWFDSFMRYQARLHREFAALAKRFGFRTVNANRSVRAVQEDLRAGIEAVLGGDGPRSEVSP